MTDMVKPNWEGEFASFEDWVNNAVRALSGTPNAVCVDARGRRCWKGLHFQRARDEGAFPVRWFRELAVS